MPLKSKLLTKKILPSCFLLLTLFIFSSLIALSIWIQVYPQELKSLIFNRYVSGAAVFYSFVRYLIIFFILLSLVNITLLVFRYSQRKKLFSWISCLLGQAKAMWPILLLALYPLRAFVSIGSQPAWIDDQTTFYFVVFFVLVTSWTFYNLFKNITPAIFSALSKKRVRFLLWAFFISFIFIFGYFSILRLQDLGIEKPDSHAFITVSWNTAHGNLLRYTYLDGPRNWFGLHFEPLIFLFVPLYLIRIPEIFVPILLQLIQVVIGASGVFPVFFLARKKLKSAFLGLVFGLVYLLFPAFQFQILYDFHIEIISLVSILWSIYFLELKRYKFSLIFLILAIFSREEFAIYASLFGLYLLFKKERSKKLGILLLTSGFFYLLLVKSLIIPYFGQGDLVPAQVSMYFHLGENLPQIVKTFLFKPGYILNFMFTQRKIQYLVLMFLPSGLVSLLSPLVLLSLPFFAINLLLGFDLPSSIYWHYQSWLIPILIWAAIDFVSKEKEKAKKAACALLLTSSLLSSLYFGPLNLLNFNLGNTQKGLAELKKSPEIDKIEDIKKLIPEDKSLATDTGLAPYFANRKDFYLFPETRTVDYIVTSLKSFNNHPQLNSILKENGYCLKIFPGILVYRKEERCSPLWRDNIIDSSQPILPRNSTTEILSFENLSPDKFPISPSKLNLPSVLNARISLKSDGFEDQIKNIICLIEGQILSICPNIVKIQASKDGRVYEEVLRCSSSPEKRCTFLVEVTKFINRNRELNLRLYLFADSLFSKEFTDVRIERLVLRNLKLVSDLK